MGQYFVARFLSISYNFLSFLSEIIIKSAISNLSLIENIILTATISCTIYLLPLEYSKKFADEKDTKHADPRETR